MSVSLGVFRVSYVLWCTLVVCACGPSDSRKEGDPAPSTRSDAGDGNDRDRLDGGFHTDASRGRDAEIESDAQTGASADRAIVVSDATGVLTREGGAFVAFTISLSAQPSHEVHLRLSSSAPNEGVPDVDAVVFTPSDWREPRAVRVTGVDDPDKDGTQPYTILVEPAASDDAGYNGLDPRDLQLVNVDDETAAITVQSPDDLSVAEDGPEGELDVRLESRPTHDVVISLSVVGKADVTLSAQQLTFTSENWQERQRVQVRALNDAVADGAQTLVIELRVRESEDKDYKVIDPRDVPVRTVDDDVAGVNVSPTANLLLHESDCSITKRLTVSLKSQPTAAVTVPVTSTIPSAAAPSPSELRFTPETWNVPQFVQLRCQDDLIATGVRIATVTIGPSRSVDLGYESGAFTHVVKPRTSDNETAGYSLVSTSELLTHELGGEASFELSLHTEPSAVAIVLSVEPAGEAQVTPSTVRMDGTNWKTPIKITVKGIEDNVSDGDKTYTVRARVYPTSDTPYQGLPDQTHALLNLDSYQHYLNSSPIVRGKGLSFVRMDLEGSLFLFTNQDKQVLVYDRRINTTSVESIDESGSPVRGTDASMSTLDGRYVAFAGNAREDENKQIYLRDRITKVTTLVTKNAAGGRSRGDSLATSMSADGRYLTFLSDASDLVANDTNGTYDTFVYDRETGALKRISVGPGGVQSDGSGFTIPIFSGDGSTVVFLSRSTTLVPGQSDGASVLYAWSRATDSLSPMGKMADGKYLGVRASSLRNPYAVSFDGTQVVALRSKRVIDPWDREIYLIDRTREVEATLIARPRSGVLASDELLPLAMDAESGHLATFSARSGHLEVLVRDFADGSFHGVFGTPQRNIDFKAFGLSVIEGGWIAFAAREAGAEPSDAIYLSHRRRW